MHQANLSFLYFLLIFRLHSIFSLPRGSPFFSDRSTMAEGTDVLDVDMHEGEDIESEDEGDRK